MLLYVQAQELKLRGNDLFKQSKLDEAARCYEEAILLSVGDEEKDSVVAVYHQNLAAVYDVLVSMGEGGAVQQRLYMVNVFHTCTVICTHMYVCAYTVLNLSTFFIT